MTTPAEIARAPARKHRPGTATYDKGRTTAEKILHVAQRIVISDGMTQLSMRRVARELGISPGNLSYYYASKQDLLEDLIAHVLQPYLEEFERLRALEADSAEAQLQAVLEFVFDDLSTKGTTHFFPELWVMALHDEWAARQMERLYDTYRAVLREIVHTIRPDLDDTQVADLVLTISASIEGHTVFIGYGREHAARAPYVKTLIIRQLVSMVLTASDGKQATTLQPQAKASG